MRPTPKRPRLFEHTGISLRCMVVDRDTLAVRPVVHELFKSLTGTTAARVERGDMVWTNALAAHLVSISPAVPPRTLRTISKKLNAEIKSLNEMLAVRNAMLLPGAAHPFMDPTKETVLWPHDGSGIYAAYDRIVGCGRHGWSNSQGLLLDLPFASDEEFTKLHAAARLVLPIIPALCASSPLLEGAATGLHDARLDAWPRRAERVPQLSGPLIPEAVFTQEDYYRVIYSPIGQALARADKQRVLDHLAANARLAVPRFEEGILRIRAIDTQECVGADVAVAELISAVIKSLAQNRWVSNYLQRAWGEGDLQPILLRTMKDGLDAVINDKDYLLMFGVLREERMPAKRLWEHLFEQVRSEMGERSIAHVTHILTNGDLAGRILKRSGRKPDRARILEIYSDLAGCLEGDRSFA